MEKSRAKTKIVGEGSIVTFLIFVHKSQFKMIWFVTGKQKMRVSLDVQPLQLFRFRGDSFSGPSQRFRSNSQANVLSLTDNNMKKQPT